MSMPDDLERLSKLHREGSLSDEEFARAKEMLLNEPTSPAPLQSSDSSLGQAANRYVTLQIVLAVIGFAVALFFIFGVILPHSHPPR